MNLRRDISLPSLHCQWWTTGLFGVSTITMWGVFLWLLIWGCWLGQSQFQWQSTAWYSGWLTTFLHSLPKWKWMSHMHHQISCSLTDSLYNGRQLIFPHLWSGNEAADIFPCYCHTVGIAWESQACWVSNFPDKWWLNLTSLQWTQQWLMCEL